MGQAPHETFAMRLIPLTLTLLAALAGPAPPRRRSSAPRPPESFRTGRRAGDPGRPEGLSDHDGGTDHAPSRRSPRATSAIIASGRGRCSRKASPTGASSHVRHSSSPVSSTGIAFR
jgi:hypothetical protein